MESHPDHSLTRKKLCWPIRLPGWELALPLLLIKPSLPATSAKVQRGRLDSDQKV